MLFWQAGQWANIRHRRDTYFMGWTSFMAKTTTTLWDASEHLNSNEDRVAYLEAALDDGDPALITAALGDIARAKGMTQIARDTGLGRESLYKALSPEGNPEFSTVMKVMRALGLKLHAEMASVV